MQEEQREESRQDKQTFDESSNEGKSRMMWSTVAGMDLLNDHARRLTETAAISENCGE